MLRDAELGFFIRMPADGRRIEQYVRALQRRQARAFGIPLIPADQRAHAPMPGIKGPEAQIARRKVKLLVVERIIRNVHLAVDAPESTVDVENGGGVVVKPAGTALEDRGHDHDLVLARHRRQSFRGRTRDGLGQVEQSVVLALAEILSPKKLRQTDNLGAFLHGFPSFSNRATKVLLGIGRTRHLDQTDGKCLKRQSILAFFLSVCAMSWRARRILAACPAPCVTSIANAAAYRCISKSLKDSSTPTNFATILLGGSFIWRIVTLEEARRTLTALLRLTANT